MMASVDYSASDFTALSDDLFQKLGREIKCLHTKDEYLLLKRRLKAAIGGKENFADKIYDGNVQFVYTKIISLFSDIFEQEELPEFPIRVNEKNEEQVWSCFDGLSEKLKSQEEIDRQFLEEVYKLYTEYKSSKDYIRRLVIRRLRAISPEFVCARDDNGAFLPAPECIGFQYALRHDIDAVSTRLLILKQFVKQFGWCEGVKGDDDHGRGFECERLRQLIGENSFQKTAEAMEEDIFEQLQERRTATGALERKENNLRIVNIAKNIGDGYFQKNSNNRESLYVFAIAFEMIESKSRSLPQKSDSDYNTDIRRNLFFDFYTDNLMNVLSGEDTERDITGYGINYKNFTEVAYLRCIHNPGTALEKLREARWIIDSCTKKGRPDADEEVDNAENDRADWPEALTVAFRKDFYKNLRLPKIKFRDFLLSHYVCGYEKKDLIYGKSEKSYEYGESLRTAASIYSVFTSDKIRAKRKEALILHSFSCGLALEIPQNIPEDEKQKRQNFNKVIMRYAELIEREADLLKFASGEANDEYLSGESNDPRGYEGVLNNGSLTTRGQDRYRNIRDKHGNPIVIRSDLLIAVFDYILVSYSENERKIDSDKLHNFSVFYNYVLTDKNLLSGYTVNSILLGCGFMEISPKSIFDLLLLYNTYQHLVSLYHIHNA